LIVIVGLNCVVLVRVLSNYCLVIGCCSCTINEFLWYKIGNRTRKYLNQSLPSSTWRPFWLSSLCYGPLRWYQTYLFLLC